VAVQQRQLQPPLSDQRQRPPERRRVAQDPDRSEPGTGPVHATSLLKRSTLKCRRSNVDQNGTGYDQHQREPTGCTTCWNPNFRLGM